MKDKLLPCPFCGGKAKIEATTFPHAGWGFIINCCLMINYDKLYKTKAEAIKAWNRRAK